MKFHDYLRSVAETLADAEPGYEYSRYSCQFLTETLNDGLAYIVAQRPELFTEFGVLKLNVGSLQDARPMFTKLYDIVAQVGHAGEIIRKLDGARTNATAVKSRWSKPSCLVDDSAGFILTSAQLDGTALGRFHVTPPVPYNTDVWVQVKGVKQPHFVHSETDYELTWPVEVLASLKHYVAAVAARIDGELQTEQLQMQLFGQMAGMATTPGATVTQPLPPDVKP